MKNHHSCSDAIYGLGVIGAAVYFFQHVSNFGEGIMAIIKAFFWPAFVVFKAMGLLKI